MIEECSPDFTTLQGNVQSLLVRLAGILSAEWLGLDEGAVDPETGLPVQNQDGINPSIDEIFMHNHPGEVGASLEDLQVAWLAEAESVIIVTPEGFEYIYSRGESGMTFEGKRDLPFEVAPATAEEYLELQKLSKQQAVVNYYNRPEYSMFQDKEWWQNTENLLLGKYELQPGETAVEIANRMDIPLDLLVELNSDENFFSSVIVIPIPGWQKKIDTTGTYGRYDPGLQQQIKESGGDYLVGHAYHRSMYWAAHPISISLQNDSDVQRWWESLSPTEKYIEMILTATAENSESAPFANSTPFDEVIGYFEREGIAATIQEQARLFEWILLCWQVYWQLN